MRLTYPLTAALSILLVAAACKKSNNSSNSNSIQGNWNFSYMTAQTVATVVAGPSTSITYSNYKTKNNAGTVSFTSKDSMAITNLTYSVDTTAIAYIYTTGQPTDTLTAPVKFTLPPTSQTVFFQLVGTDSIYFPGGGIGSSVPTGGHYQIAGDSLKMSVQGTQAVTGGTESAVSTIVLKRQ